MKKRDYVISVKGMQSYADALMENTDIEMMSECDLTLEDGKYFAEYEETEATGMEGTTTTIEVGGEYVSIVRSGKVSTTLLFIKGRQTTSYYDTPFGTMIMGITTDDITTDLTLDGGKVSVTYSISMNNIYTGKNTFEINIRKF
ncbi:MAG: DUF1934 domain-containing protein [Clostridia bacterium]|nr:DUF1934 domain-containing protein [Clostridia bacterium]